ncbi:MAG TPA: hypothetical protein VM925_32570, partial [Labilithrix sp.]|nr:hypothetical protein [Labilithrix sp.]
MSRQLDLVDVRIADADTARLDASPQLECPVNSSWSTYASPTRTRLDSTPPHSSSFMRLPLPARARDLLGHK